MTSQQCREKRDSIGVGQTASGLNYKNEGPRIDLLFVLWEIAAQLADIAKELYQFNNRGF